MSSFAIYIIGFVIVVAGLAYAASIMGLDQTWIIIGAVVLLGFGLLTAATKTKRPDPPAQ
jgi:positive regulator of sigma E activity